MPQVNYPNTGEVFVMVWFAVSVFIEVVSTFVLWLWLRRLCGKFTLGLTGTPGYMEYFYVKWCRSQGRRHSRGLLAFRVISLINVIVASVFFIHFVVTR